MQGLMFGYATDETEECMPLTLVLAHQMNKKISDLRRDGTLWWARPDTKTQVTAEYIFDNGACVPIRVHTVVVSCQHSEKVTLEALRKDIMEKVVYTEGRVDRSAAYAKIRRRAKRNRAEREPLK